MPIMKFQNIIRAEDINKNNYRICVAVDCYAKATKTIEVGANLYGETISLLVCDGCVSKFNNIVSNSEIEEQKQQ
jgi:hypothetical protein